MNENEVDVTKDVKVTVVKVNHPNPEKLTDPTYFDPTMFAEAPDAEVLVMGGQGKGKTGGKR